MIPELVTKIYAGDVIYGHGDFDSYKIEVEENEYIKLHHIEQYRTKENTIRYLKSLISLVENLEV